jgi:hypothetical protein
MTVVAAGASAARPYKLRFGANNGINFLSEFIKPLPAAMNHDPRQHSGMDGR